MNNVTVHQMVEVTGCFSWLLISYIWLAAALIMVGTDNIIGAGFGAIVSIVSFSMYVKASKAIVRKYDVGEKNEV